MRRVLTPLTAIAVLLSLGLSVPASAVSTPTTTIPFHAPPVAVALKLLNTAVHDAKTQKWVHEHTVINETGITITSTTATLGTETLEGKVTTSGILGTGSFSVIDLIKTNREYVEGTAGGLGAFDHIVFTSALAPSYVGKWIRLTQASEDFASIEGGTLSAQFSQLTLSGSVELAATRYAGQRARAISQTTGGVTETIYVSDAPKPLPIGFFTATSGVTETTTWSNWGHGSAPDAPTNYVAFPTAPPVTTTLTTTPASAAFCPAVSTLGTAYTTFVATGTGTVKTLTEATAALSALTAEVSGLVTDLGNVIAAAPTPALSVDYTVLLGYAKAFAVSLSLITAALAQLPAGAGETTIEGAITPYETRLAVDLSVLTFNKPTNAAASVFCPAPTTTSTTTTTPPA
jgi:hypothetical protein